jgi:hypothetical protein
LQRTPFELKEVTPACAAGKRRHAFYAAVFQSAPRGVKQEAQNTTLLFSTASTAFIFSTTLLFALSRFVFHPTFNLCHVAFLFIPRTLLFRFFNGGKVSDLHSVSRSLHDSVLHSHHIFSSLRVALSFGVSRYF